MDEECKFPKANDKTLSDKLDKLFINPTIKNLVPASTYYSKPRFEPTSFIVKHYADPVTYDCKYFLDKNRDYVIPDQINMLQSASSLCAKLFSTSNVVATNKNQNFQFTSVAMQFKDSLTKLMDSINATYPHYIRCIKPNSLKKPGLFTKRLVLKQLKCGGILESIRITLEGYPTKKSYQEFIQRYKLVVPISQLSKQSERDQCLIMLKKMNINPSQYQFGSSKLFLRANQIEKIEYMRQYTLNSSQTLIAKMFKGYKTNKWFRSMKQSTLLLTSAARGLFARNELVNLRKNHASQMLQSLYRQFKVRTLVRRQMSLIKSIQRLARARLSYDRSGHEQLILSNTTCIQSTCRGYLIRKVFYDMLREARAIQLIKKQKEGLEVHVQTLEYELEREIKIRTQLEKEQERRARENESKVKSLSLQSQEQGNLVQSLEQQNKQLLQQVNLLKVSLVEEQRQKNKLEEGIKKSNLSVTSTKEESSRQVDQLLETINKLKLQVYEHKQQSEHHKKDADSLRAKLSLIEKERAMFKRRKEAEMNAEIERLLKNMIVNKLASDEQEAAERFMVFLFFEMNQMDYVDVLPSPSFLIYHLISYWVAHGKNSERLLKLTSNSIKGVTKLHVHTNDYDWLTYWFSNIASLLHLFLNEDSLSDVLSKLEIQLSIEQVRSVVEKSLSDPNHYQTFDQDMDVDNSNDDKYDFVRFLEDMCSMFVKTMTHINKNTVDELTLPLRTDGSLLDRSHDTSQDPLIIIMSRCVRSLRKHKVGEGVIVHVLRQLCYFIDVSTFNQILLRKDVCSMEKAMSIKWNASVVDGQVSEWADEQINLEHVRQATTLLMAHKNEIVQHDVRIQSVPLLTFAQIEKIYTMFTPSEFEQGISSRTFSYLSDKMKQDSTDKTLMLQPNKPLFIGQSQIRNSAIEAQLYFLSFPHSVKDGIEKMWRDQQIKDSGSVTLDLRKVEEDNKQSTPSKPKRKSFFSFSPNK